MGIEREHDRRTFDALGHQPQSLDDARVASVNAVEITDCDRPMTGRRRQLVGIANKCQRPSGSKKVYDC